MTFRPLSPMPLGLDDDAAGHLRMHAAVVWVFSRLCEAKLELLVRVQRRRFEFALRTVDRVRDVIVVDPGHLRSTFDRDGSRCEGKIVDLHFRC